MKRTIVTLTAVAFYGYGTGLTVAATCNDFRSDIQTIQQQQRQDQFTRMTSGIDAVRIASNTVKSACLDALSALDMTAFGFTPGAAAVITKLSSAACQKLVNDASQGVGQVTQQMSQGNSSGTNEMTQPSQVSGGLAGQLPDQATQSVTGQITSAIGNAWDSLKSFMGP
jgi:hypothetical protein